MLPINMVLQNKTVLVTGAAGFIGSNLAMELLRTAEGVKVVGLDNMNDYYDVSIKEYRLTELEKLASEHPECEWEFIEGNLADRALVDWGVHFLDLILYILGDAKLKNVTCDAYSEMAKDMKSYKYIKMWAEDTKDIENGVNDVDDFITGYIRTDKASISFNGAWAQNLDKPEMFIDVLGDKKGARLAYGGQFEVTDGETLETVATNHEIPNMYLREDEDFFNSIESGIKNKNNIDNILESMKLLDYLYRSAEIGKEIQF